MNLKEQITCFVPVNLNEEQKRRLFALTDMFEHSTPDARYCGDTEPEQGGAPDLNDGRGYCMGIVGFCTGTGDLVDVVEEYTKHRPDNVLTGYLPRLKDLAKKQSDSTAGLKGLVTAWNHACQDEEFRKAQDTIRDRLYLNPALDLAKSIGVASALGKAIIYDSVVQHGHGGTEDLISRLKKNTPQTPAQNTIDEKDWLYKFLEVRRHELESAEDEKTRATWSDSAPRVDALKHLIDDDKMNLCTSLKLRSRDWNETIP